MTLQLNGHRPVRFQYGPVADLYDRVLNAATFRAVPFGVETLPAGTSRPRHRHGAGYATVVLSGCFEEASFCGRLAVGPGEVLLHGAFDCHADRPLSRQRIQILRLPWHDQTCEGRFRIADADALVRVAQADPAAASALLAASLEPLPERGHDWPHALALLLRIGRPPLLQQWAAEQRLQPAELSRGFRGTFGVSPKRFRLEARTRRAWQAILGSRRSLTRIAQDHEFADLAHMSRSVRAFTSLTPSAWRGALPGPGSQVRSS
jgi:AraC-like DNA-binding protein